MVSKLLHRLQTELDGAEADGCSSLLDGWVELPQRQHRLSIGLLIEDNCHAEACRVIVDVGAVIQHKAPRRGSQFLQRRGRAGRPRKMRPWTIVTLSDPPRSSASARMPSSAGW